MAVADEFHETSRGANYPATPKSAAAEPQYLIRMKSAWSTEFPLRRLAVCGCFPPTVFVILTNQKCQSYPFFLPPLQQTGHPGTSTPYRDKSELQNYVPPRRFRYASSHSFRTPPHTHVLSRRGANHAVAPKSAVAEPACRQWRPGSVGGHFHQPLLSLSPTKNVNYTYFGGCNYSSTGLFRKCLTVNHLQSKHVRRSTSERRLADRQFRENRPAAASKAIFAKTIVLGYLHLPCPVRCRAD